MVCKKITATFKNPLLARLSKPVYYRQALQRLHKKFSWQRSYLLYESNSEGYTLAQALTCAYSFSKALSQDVASGTHFFSPASIGTVMAGNKSRRVYQFLSSDRIIHGAAYEMLAEAFASITPASVYSYTPGRSRKQALSTFARFIKQHRRLHADPRQRGLYVLRCDVQSYGESIPVDAHSPLWPQLEKHYQDAMGAPLQQKEMDFLKKLITPPIQTAEGTHVPTHGIPDGSPISALLLNLYLLPLDHAMGAMEGGFYARFGDDIIFAHENLEVFTHVQKVFERVLSQLGLKANKQKYRAFFFNGAGRRAASFKGSTHVEFLGMQVDFTGRIGLKAQKLRKLRRHIARLAEQSHAALVGLSLENRGRALCQMVNGLLDPHAEGAHPYASLLVGLADDRRQLRQFDYWLARTLAQILLNKRGVRVFRQIPYRTLRGQWQLHSLEYGRNS